MGFSSAKAAHSNPLLTFFLAASSLLLFFYAHMEDRLNLQLRPSLFGLPARSDFHDVPKTRLCHSHRLSRRPWKSGQCFFKGQEEQAPPFCPYHVPKGRLLPRFSLIWTPRRTLSGTSICIDR